MHKPWLNHYDPGAKPSLSYPDLTLYEVLKRSAMVFRESPAVAFEGTHLSFTQILSQTDRLAASLAADGVAKGDIVTICLPNVPHALLFFYAVNKLGAVANMVHPKTPQEELRDIMRFTRSERIVLLDAFAPRYNDMVLEDWLRRVYVAKIGDFLSPLMKIGFYIAKGRKIKKPVSSAKWLPWKTLIHSGDSSPENDKYQRLLTPSEAAVYLHSGGTTGAPKTVVLSSAQLNVLAAQGPQIVNIPDPHVEKKAPDHRMLTILPLFHGFGLGMGMHTMIFNGVTAVLVPLFTPDALVKALISERVTMIAAVPTLYESMLRNKKLRNRNLHHLTNCFCGGDSLSSELKERVEAFLHTHGANIPLREGYGLTETVTVCAVNPQFACKSDSVGLPLADILMKVIDPENGHDLPIGEKGEICVHGPTTMLGYLQDPEGTAHSVRLHEDGLDWVHTGDYGYMDEDGYFYFVQRLKRIIKVSGIPVFPSRIEEVLDGVSGVSMSCAVAIPDDYKQHVVKALVVPDTGLDPVDLPELETRIRQACEKYLFPHARPVVVEFREELPLTPVGKVDYKALEGDKVAES